MTSSEDRHHFDQAAAKWDESPRRREQTDAIANAICRKIPLDRHWRAMEYGCGTANLSFLLAPKLGEVIAADASAGMIEQVQQKLKSIPSTNVHPLLLDLTAEAPPPGTFNLIYLAMCLHHVENVPAILSRFGEMLKHNGWLAIADLCLDDGSFHEGRKVPHNGFDPAVLSRLCEEAIQPANCDWETIHTVEKNGRNYDIFLLTVTKATETTT